MHKTFFPLILTSLAGIALAAFFHQASGVLQGLGLVAGLLPLITYHFALTKARVLTSTEVDSVYYFGFLVTIITLVSTAISIGIAAKKPDLNWVLLQFGLGLVATGYALFARLHLLASSTATSEVDVVASTEKLVKNIEKIAREFDNAGFQVKAFVERTEQRLAQYEQEYTANLESISEKYVDQISSAQATFQEGLNKSLKMSLEKSAKAIGTSTERFSNAISSVMEEIVRMQNEAQSISFSLASQRIREFSVEMEGSIRSITASVHETATASSAAVAELTSTLNKTSKLAGEISKKLKVLDGMVALVGSIEAATDAITGFAHSTSDADSAISSFSVKTAQAEETMRDKITKPLEAAKFSQALEDFERGFAVASVSLNDNLVAIAQSLPTVKASASLMGQNMGSVAQSLTRLGDSINVSPAQLSVAVNHLKEQVSAVSNLIEIALPELNKAISSLASKVSALDVKRPVDTSPSISSTNA